MRLAKMQPNSPFWSILRTVAVLVFITVLLLIHSSKFDETEVKVLAWAAIGLTVLEVAYLRIHRK